MPSKKYNNVTRPGKRIRAKAYPAQAVMRVVKSAPPKPLMKLFNMFRAKRGVENKRS